MEAKVLHTGGLQFLGIPSSGHAIVMDGPEKVGGSDTALRPSELLLVGLGGCTGMDVISILKKKRQNIQGFEIKVKGTQSDREPKKFTEFTIHYIVKGKEISEDAVKRAIELSMEKYCSVKATLEGGAEISHSYEIVEV